MRSFWTVLAMGVVAACLASGCGTAQARRVNVAALAVRASQTDDVSRRLASQSRQLISERAEDYRVGPGDLLEISIFEWELREETKTALFRVAESGVVALPVMGNLQVGGKTVGEVKRLIETVLKDGGFILKPRVSVDIREYRSKRVAVVGAVNDPGVYTLRQNVTTLLEILSLAGGVSEEAGNVLYVVRAERGQGEAAGAAGTAEPEKPDAGAPAVIAIDLYDLLERGNLALNAVLRHGDVVNVPEAKPFSVIGYVREPGSFPIKKPTTVLEGIAVAGGVMVREASPGRSVLKRQTAGGEIIIPLDLVAISRGVEPNLYLQPNDIIDVRQTAEKRLGLELLEILKSVLNVGFVAN